MNHECVEIRKEMDELIVKLLKEGDEDSYRYIYKNHYSALCHFAMQYVRNKDEAQNIVDDVILHLWEIRDTLNIQTSLRGFLIQSVRNRCLNILKSKQYKIHSREVEMDDDRVGTALESSRYIVSDQYPLGQILEKELEYKLEDVIKHLPDECREVFLLSRFENLSQKEIAKKLHISVSNVKYHIGNALRILSSEVSKYLYLWIILFFLIK